MTVTVYQYFTRSGRLIYVGVTCRGIRRSKEHAETKAWWPEAAGCRLEHFDKRDDALRRRERMACMKWAWHSGFAVMGLVWAVASDAPSWVMGLSAVLATLHTGKALAEMTR